MKLVMFTGAKSFEDEDGGRKYIPRGPVFINPNAVCGVYDHTILTGDKAIHVLEEGYEIKKKLEGENEDQA